MHGLRFQGELSNHFPFHRHREMEGDAADPEPVLCLLRVDVHALHKGLHEALLVSFRECRIQLVEGQQQLVNLFAGKLFLADQLELLIYFILLGGNLGQDIILIVIPALKVRDLLFVVRIVDGDAVHLALEPGFDTLSLTPLGFQGLELLFKISRID